MTMPPPAPALPQPASSIRVADAVASMLHAAGVRAAFGMPGGEIVTFLDALERSGIRFVLMRHETPAAIAAGATHLTTGAPGLLVTTLGPGLANAVNGIADAVQERTPLLVVSAAVEHRQRGGYTHQILSHPALLAGLVKGSFELDRFDPAATVARAIRLAMTPPMGPVHLDLAPDVAAALGDGLGHDRGAPALFELASPDAADAGLRAIREALAASARPIVIAGYDAARGKAGPALESLADAYGLPVITTYKGKGVLDERGSHALGAAGLSPLADKTLLALVKQSDLVLLIGYDPIEMRPGWLDPFPPTAPVFELGVWRVDHGMYHADRTMVGLLPDLLTALLPPHAEPAALQPSRSMGRGAALGRSFETPAPQDEGREDWLTGPVAHALSALQAAFAPPSAWGPHVVFATLQQCMPDDAVVTVDSGAHRILLSQMWRCSRPLSLLQSAGWCTMGAALPLAIGAQIAAPDRAVIAVMGDGGLEMVMGELATVRDGGLPLVILVLQDESLALIELKQRQAGLDRLGVRLGATDLPAVARALGGEGIAVRDVAALAAALEGALRRRERFTLIACAIDADAYDGKI